MAKKHFKLNVYNERCKECGICFAFCPKHNLQETKDGSPELVDPDNCTGCKLCEYMCPDFAIQIEIEADDKSEEAKASAGK